MRAILSGSTVGERVKLRGWLSNRRSSGGIVFLIMRDGTGWLQCVARRDLLGEKALEELEKLPVESVLELEGTIRQDRRAPGDFELVVERYRVLSVAEPDYPIAKKYHGPDFLLDHRHLWIRSRKMWCVLMVRAELLRAAREWLDGHGYVEVQPPILTSSACEGGATLFPVDYFGRRAYLTQSWQLYGEAFIASVGKCYT
ncbi:asparagine--tRNA ligase, partial [Candidatus Bathyarchaeota archaeon]